MAAEHVAGVAGVSKLLGALASVAFSLAGCWLARVLENGKNTGDNARLQLFLMTGNTAAAGILLSASLVHMLPDASKGLAALCDFPLSSVIAGGAFIFLSVLGEFVTDLMPRRDEPHIHTACATYQASFAILPRLELLTPAASCDELVGGPASMTQGTASCSASGGCAGHGDGDAHRQGHVHGHWSHGANSGEHGHGHFAAAPVQRTTMGASSCSAGSRSCLSHSARCRVHRHSDVPCAVADGMRWGPAAPKVASHGHFSEALLPVVEQASDQPLDNSGPSCHVRVAGTGVAAEVKSFFLFFALCFHSVMEGLGMGSATDDGLFFGVMVAILAHKGLAAFALGCSLSQSGLPRSRFWAFVAIFAAATPLGVLIGVVTVRLGGSTASKSIASSVCVALSSGTFLQVAAMELLPRSLAEERHKFEGCLALAAGFVIMSVLAIWC